MKESYKLPKKNMILQHFFAMIHKVFKPIEAERDPVDPSKICFSKNMFFRERVKSWLFVTFNILLSYILTENVNDFPQLV